MKAGSSGSGPSSLVQQRLDGELGEDPDAPELADVGEVEDAGVVEVEDDVRRAVRERRAEQDPGGRPRRGLVLGVAVDELAGEAQVEHHRQAVREVEDQELGPPLTRSIRLSMRSPTVKPVRVTTCFGRRTSTEAKRRPTSVASRSA